MAIPIDREGRAELGDVVAKRLKAARRAAGLSQADAAMALGHKGITQVSLAESGDRMPPLLDLVKYADAYCVPLDYIVGRINDPLAEPQENSQGLVVRAVSHSIETLFGKFANAVAEHVSIGVSGMREDRADIREVIRIAAEAEGALKRWRELNPEFDDLRGGATVERLLREISALGRRVDKRTAEERRGFDMIDRALEIEAVERRLSEFQLSLFIHSDHHDEAEPPARKQKKRQAPATDYADKMPEVRPQ